MPPPRFAISLPQQGEIAQAARSAEQLGFDYVSSGEHVVFHGPTPNSFVSLAAAAGATQQIGLLSAVALAPLYPPVLLAKFVAALDDVSGGRLTLGLGVGGEHPPEFEAVGVPIRERGARTDEAITTLHQLLDPNGASPSERFSRLEGVAIAPRPARRVPMWVGGRSAAGRRRAARAADGWMPYLFSPERLAAQVPLLREDVEEQGRPPGSVEVGVHIFATVADDPTAARRRAIASVSRTYQQDAGAFADRYLVYGTPEQVVRRTMEYRDAGANLFVFRLAGEDENREQMVRQLAEEVVTPLRWAYSGQGEHG